jgi:hypothetical protein
VNKELYSLSEERRAKDEKKKEIRRRKTESCSDNQSLHLFLEEGKTEKCTALKFPKMFSLLLMVMHDGLAAKYSVVM